MSTYEYTSRLMANKIISLDTELLAKMYGRNVQTKEIYQIFRQRLELFEKASTMPLTQTDRLLLDSKRANVAVELRMFNLAHTIEKELNRVILRLDKLESFLFNDFSGSRVPRQLSEPSLPPSPPSQPSPTSEPSPDSIPQP